MRIAPASIVVLALSALCTVSAFAASSGSPTNAAQKPAVSATAVSRRGTPPVTTRVNPTTWGSMKRLFR